MGHLLIGTESLNNIPNIPIASKDLIFVEFIKAVQNAGANRDATYQDEALRSGHLSFGNFWDALMSISYSKFRTNPAFDGISQPSFQELQMLFFANPSGGQIFKDTDEFERKFRDKHYGYIGLEYSTKLSPYVYSNETYHEWNIPHYSSSPVDIRWPKDSAHCLPNLSYSNLCLEDRISKDVIEDKQKSKVKTSKDYCDNFPLEKQSRENLRAIAREVGREVARRNFFIEDKELTKLESKLHGSERLIFKSMKNNREIYLSIDFHKCNCYELCDQNGIHLGEYRFDGKLNSGQDTTGGHNILALKK